MLSTSYSSSSCVTGIVASLARVLLAVISYSASIPPLPSHHTLPHQSHKICAVRGHRHRTPTVANAPNICRVTRMGVCCVTMVEAGVFGGIAQSHCTPAGRCAQDVHQFITRKHENTARRPNGEVLAAYSEIHLAQRSKPPPRATQWRRAGAPSRHRRHCRRGRGGRGITLSKQVKSERSDMRRPTSPSSIEFLRTIL